MKKVCLFALVLAFFACSGDNESNDNGSSSSGNYNSSSSVNEGPGNKEISFQVYQILIIDSVYELDSTYKGNGTLKEIITINKEPQDTIQVGTITNGIINLNLESYTPEEKYLDLNNGGMHILTNFMIYDNADTIVGGLALVDSKYVNGWFGGDNNDRIQAYYVYYSVDYAYKNTWFDQNDKYSKYVYDSDVEKGWSLFYENIKKEGDTTTTTITNKPGILNNREMRWYLVNASIN